MKFGEPNGWGGGGGDVEGAVSATGPGGLKFCARAQRQIEQTLVEKQKPT